MRIALISDTHDNIDNILKATREFNERRADIVIHAGDYASPIAVESFTGVKLIGILGNNDTDVPGLTSAFNKIGWELKGEIFESQYDGLNFAVYHGTNFNKKELLIKSAKYDVLRTYAQSIKYNFWKNHGYQYRHSKRLVSLL